MENSMEYDEESEKLNNPLSLVLSDRETKRLHKLSKKHSLKKAVLARQYIIRGMDIDEEKHK